MTSPNFRQLPRFQKKVRQREIEREAQGLAVPHIDDIVAEAGGQQAAREQFGASRSQQLDIRNKGLDLSKRRFDLSKDLTAKREATSKDLASKRETATKTFALKREAANKDIFNRNFAINREMLDIRDEQNKWATGIGIANIGVEALGAVSNIRAAEEEAKQMQLITNSFLALVDQYSSEGLDLRRRGL